MLNQPTDSPVAIDPTVAAVGGREWSVPMFEASARNRGVGPRDRLLGIFDVLDEIINRADRPARAFLVRLGRVSVAQPDNDADRSLVSDLRALVATLAVEAHVADPDELLLSWWVLMRGAILKALDGDLRSAHRARAMAVDLTGRHATVPTFFPVAESLPDSIDFDAYFDWALTDEA